MDDVIIFLLFLAKKPTTHINKLVTFTQITTFLLYHILHYLYILYVICINYGHIILYFEYISFTVN